MGPVTGSESGSEPGPMKVTLVDTEEQQQVEDDDDDSFEVVGHRRHAKNQSKARSFQQHSHHQYHGGGGDRDRDSPMNNGRRGGNNSFINNRPGGGFFRSNRYNDLNGHPRRGFGDGRGSAGPGPGGSGGSGGPNNHSHNNNNNNSNNNNHSSSNNHSNGVMTTGSSNGGVMTPSSSGLVVVSTTTPNSVTRKAGNSSSSICSESSFTDSHGGTTTRSSSGASDESSGDHPPLPPIIVDNRSENSLTSTGSGTEGTASSRTGEDKDEDESEETRLKYVDAPPPVVNPWRVNPNAASVIAKKTPQNGRLNSLNRPPPAPTPRPQPAVAVKVGNGQDVKSSTPTPTPARGHPHARAQTQAPSKQPPQPAQLAPVTASTPKPVPVPVPVTVKLQPASAKDPWDINRIRRRQESSIVSGKLSGDDWPALEPAIEEVQQNMTSLTLECKIVNFDSSSTGSGDSLEEEIQSPGKLCAEKWPLISSGDNSTTKSVRSSRKDSNDDALPSLESTQSTRQQHASGDENGSGSTSVSSDDTVAEVNMEGGTDEIEIPTRKTKKSAKLKWVPLKLPETATPKHRVKREKSLKFKSSRYDRGESPSGASGRSRGRGGPRARGPGRGSSRNSHQYFFNESSDPNVIPPPNQRDDYTDYPPDFTTLAPVFPEVSEFIMPYVADNYFANSFIQPADSPSDVTSPAVSFVPVGLEDLVELLKQQIEYYFSEENLEKDFYLRRKMDSEGYLPIKLIASFQRVQNMTHDYNIVVSAIMSSEILQVKEDMSCVRTMITPTKWPIADTLYLSVSASDFSCPVSSQVPSTNVPNGVVLSEPRSIQAV